MTPERENELLKTVLAEYEARMKEWIDLGNEIIQHLGHDAGVNGSKFTPRPYGAITLSDSPDSLAGRLLYQTTKMLSNDARKAYYELKGIE